MRYGAVWRNAIRTTGLAGLAHHPNPRPQLISIYKSTIDALSTVPSNSVYRKATTALTEKRLKIAEGTLDVPSIESQIGEGLIEELIQAAEDELSLVAKMKEWKA